MLTNKSKVKRICKANGWQLFERHDHVGYWIKVYDNDGNFLHSAESIYKNFAYEHLWKQLKPNDEWERIV